MPFEPSLKDGEMFFWRKNISSSGRSIYKKRERERDPEYGATGSCIPNITLRHVLFGLYLIRKFHVKLDSPDSFTKKK